MRMESGQSFAAHIDEDGRVHSLSEHLEETARLAERFAGVFESGAWGRLAGLWHDIGKFQPRFQQRIQGDASILVDHSVVGAKHAFKRYNHSATPLAFVIAGHHAGLANGVREAANTPTPLTTRLKKAAPWDAPEAARAYLDEALPPLPAHLPRTDNASLEFWIRFLFSALVDADFLDTERFFDAAKGSARGGYDNISSLSRRLNDYIEAMVSSIPDDVRGGAVNRTRALILDACRKAASDPPGFFSLTAPTGAGKTLSAMDFALRHAEIHGKDRVIAVIPYTSIIEQNAEEYAKALGRRNVIEHHSTFDLERLATTHGEELTDRHKLAAENWDAPVVVTTTVQFFESLFANRTSRCRKLHNIANSVVILDEVQTLPPKFLLAILDALKELVARYKCTVLLSTATPPALRRSATLPKGIENVREILNDPVSAAKALRRVRIEWPGPDAASMEWPALADEIAGHRQTLVILHRRQDARELAELVAARTGEPVFHLSALMCPAHRKARLNEIRAALDAGRRCRVVATQLVEAGVDLDFPVVYRAFAGLDSILQAAGRCNREGRLAEGRVIVFHAPTKPPAGTLARAQDTATTLMNEWGWDFDGTDPDRFETFFAHFYAASTLDEAGIQTLRREFNFADVARKFRLIDDTMVSIVAPYGGASGLLRELAAKPLPDHRIRRLLQRFTVQVNRRIFDAMIAAGELEEICEGVVTLTEPYRGHYDDIYGLTFGGPADPAALVIG